MKARIKKTGEIINIAPYAKVELDVCDSRGNPIAVEFDEIELVQDTDYESFRREAAKDILCALAGNKDYLKVIGRIEPETMLAIRFADELVKQLREEK